MKFILYMQYSKYILDDKQSSFQHQSQRKDQKLRIMNDVMYHCSWALGCIIKRKRKHKKEVQIISGVKKKTFINHCQRNQCLCEMLQWGSRQRAAPSIIVSHLWAFVTGSVALTAHSHHVSLSIMDRSPSAGPSAGSSLWASCCITHRRIPPGALAHK